MKTPRQVLFEKHRSAQPALDQVRRKALAALRDSPPGRQRLLPVRIACQLWDNLIVPSRRTWSAIAAAWIFIVGFALAQAIETPGEPVSQMACSPEIVLALRQQQREFKELVRTEAPPPDSAEPQLKKPQPRSSLKPVVLIG